MRFPTIVLALTAACAALPALAQPAASPRPERKDQSLQQYCTGDYFRFCGNIAPESPEVDRCFSRNWNALSAGCRTAIDGYDKGSKGRKS